ncbi:ABC transporter ATP-binding protein [Haloferax sp. YSMS24]|uniref:ABC transporter ATP-binding protein n=1 Tax=Haloferax sp. YSMS24 TaxID=3388425 RepID=UPI00398D625F
MSSQEQPTDTSTAESTILEVEGVSKRFGGLVAVDDVSFTLDQGTILGVIGPNGAGKTTLFNVVNGFLDPEEGSVRLNGVDITHADPSEHAKQGMARTFQLVKPFGPLTVLDNVMVGSFLKTGSRKEAEKLAMKRLEFLGLEEIADVPAQNITVAQKKKMELCRALATDPEIILVDEVMAGLQQEEQREILDALERINNAGTTIVLIEHVMDALMEISERIIVLNEGKLIADGEPDEIGTNDEVIEAYLGESWREQQERMSDA